MVTRQQRFVAYAAPFVGWLLIEALEYHLTGDLVMKFDPILLYLISPYCVLSVIATRFRMATVPLLTLVFTEVYCSILVGASESSTAVLGLLMIPVYQLLLALPGGLLLGWWVGKRLHG